MYMRSLSSDKPQALVARPIGTTIAQWRGPPDGMSKINVDGEVQSNELGTVGAICRDQNGVYLGPSTIIIPSLH